MNIITHTHTTDYHIHIHDDHETIHLCERDHERDHVNNVVHYHDHDIIDAFEMGYVEMWGQQSFDMLGKHDGNINNVNGGN